MNVTSFPMHYDLSIVYVFSFQVRLTSSGPLRVVLANDPTYPKDQVYLPSSLSTPNWWVTSGNNKQVANSYPPDGIPLRTAKQSHRANDIQQNLQTKQAHRKPKNGKWSKTLGIGKRHSKKAINEKTFGLSYKKGVEPIEAAANNVVPKENSEEGSYGGGGVGGPSLEWEKTIKVEVVTRRFEEIVKTSTLRPSTDSGQSRGYRLERTRIHMTSRVRNSLLRPKPLLDHFHGLHFGIMDPAEFPQRPPVKPSYSVEGTFLWAVGLFGTVENGAVLLTAIFSKKFKKPLHLLIGSLAVTDLFVSLIYIPSYTYYLLEGDRMLQKEGEEEIGQEVSGLTYCKLSRSIFVEIASVTLTIKALIAFYFYISACSRELVSQIFSSRNTLLFIFLAWGMNFVMLFIPKILGYQEVDFYPNSFICTTEKRVEMHHTFSRGTASAVYTFVTLSVHIAELMVIGACFVKVHMAIIRGKSYSDKHRSADKQAKVNYMRALKITCLVFVSFCICWMPIYIINILDPSHETLPTDVHHLVMDLLLLKSSINPTIYIYGIRSLRYEIKLLCLCRCRSDNNKDVLAVHKAKTSSEGGVSGTFSTLSGGV